MLGKERKEERESVREGKKGNERMTHENKLRKIKGLSLLRIGNWC